MEHWLEDVKRVRIPRPKFGSSSSTMSSSVGGGGVGTASRCCYPMEPPKDYQLTYEDASAALSSISHQMKFDLSAATEDLRRAIQEKL